MCDEINNERALLVHDGQPRSTEENTWLPLFI